jgi:hypothetical protein
VAEGATSGCGPQAACANYPMRCGAKIMVRIVDAAETEVLGEICQTVSNSELVDAGAEGVPPLTLCELRPTGSQATLRGIPFQMVRIQVAVWAPNDPDDAECPAGDIFDGLGGLRSNFNPQPAFGGAVYFDMNRSDSQVWVDLRCSDVEQINADWCEMGSDSTPIVARVDDLSTGITVSEVQAEKLDVAAAEPRPTSGSPDTIEYEIPNDALLHLSHAVEPGGQPPTFTGEETGEIEGTLCVVVEETGARTQAAVCEDVVAGTSPVELRGIRVSDELMEDFLGILGQERFPSSGMVIGRVLDHNGSPLEAVTLSVSGQPEVVVEYLNENRTAFDGAATASHGYFISRNAPFGSVWLAFHPDGRREAAGTLRTGVIQNRISPLILRMRQVDELVGSEPER